MPRTLAAAMCRCTSALTGARFAVNSSSEFARSLGFPRAPLDDLLAFHMVFGKPVPDFSLNAVANLGYARGRFQRPVYPGDMLSVGSTVIGLRELTGRQACVVDVPSSGADQTGRRWSSIIPLGHGGEARREWRRRRTRWPVLPEAELLANLAVSASSTCRFLRHGAGPAVQHRWGDYAVGD